VKVTTTVPAAVTVAPVICDWSPAPGFEAPPLGRVVVVGAVVGAVVLVGVAVVGAVVLVGVTVFGAVVLVVVVVSGPRAHVDSAPPSQLHRPALQAAEMAFLLALVHRRLALRCKPSQLAAMAALQRWRLHGLTAAPAVEAMAAIAMANQNVICVPRAGIASPDARFAKSRLLGNERHRLQAPRHEGP